MTTFYNFAVKIETSWGKRVVKPILKTRNPNIIMYNYFIYSQRIILNVQSYNKKAKIGQINRKNKFIT